MRRTGRGAISDEAVADVAALIEHAQVAEWLEAELLARQRRPGRPRRISVKALLCALLLLATDDRPLHLSGATEVLFVRLSAQAQAALGVEGRVVDRRSFLARYRQVRYLFGTVAKVLDPSGLVKNRRLASEEFTAAASRSMTRRCTRRAGGSRRSWGRCSVPAQRSSTPECAAT